jgi:ABC-type spermidine/putrescine transport system permease subunit II
MKASAMSHSASADGEGWVEVLRGVLLPIIIAAVTDGFALATGLANFPL